MSKNDKKKPSVEELMADLQRTRADFENYRKRVEQEKVAVAASARANMILKLLPLLDNVDLATRHLPEDLQDHDWAKGVATLNKNLTQILSELGVSRILADPGTVFDPELHDAVSFDAEDDNLDENNDGFDAEVISEELRPGYKFSDTVIRPTMVRVTRR